MSKKIDDSFLISIFGESVWGKLTPETQAKIKKYSLVCNNCYPRLREAWL